MLLVGASSTPAVCHPSSCPADTGSKARWGTGAMGHIGDFSAVCSAEVKDTSSSSSWHGACIMRRVGLYGVDSYASVKNCWTV